LRFKTRLLSVTGAISFGIALAPLTSQQAQAAPAAECPPALMAKCSFDPAAYVNNNPADFTDYSNYDLANRPADGTKIRGVTIHDVEGTCEAAVDHYQDPTSFVSATYTICADGRVIQSVPLRNITWTAGNWWYNMHFVQIEVAGYASQPGSITPAATSSAVLLVRWLSQKFRFPINRATVHGHDNVPGQRDANFPGMHVDPGPFFNWQNFMAMLGAPVVPQGNVFTSKFVTIAPIWPLSHEVVTGCNVSNQTPPPCVPSGQHNTNFVYLHTQPNLSSPLITDPLTGPGSTDIENRSARAFYGEKFVVATRHIDKEKKGIWFKIWFGGQGAWFYSPFAAPTAFPTKGQCVTPKSSTAVSLYGRPLPELSEWPTNLAYPPGSQPAQTALSYTVAPGQCYTVIDPNVTPDHYFTWSFGNELPRFRMVGATTYVWVFYGGRQGFLKKSDVTIS